MISANHRRVGWGLVLLVLLLMAAPVAQGAIITLSAITTASMLGPDGNPLQDGSVVMIWGSYDSLIDPMVSWGTNYIAEYGTGDDVFIGYARVDFGDGTIDTGGYTFNSDDVNYLYLRFFDTTNIPVQGYVAWGTSHVWGYTSSPIFDVRVDFAPDPIQVNHTNNFVIIPEPGTLNYFLMFLGLVVGMRASFVRKRFGGTKN